MRVFLNTTLRDIQGPKKMDEEDYRRMFNCEIEDISKGDDIGIIIGLK